MTQRLRVLIELDGKTCVDQDVDVSSVTIEFHNPIFESPYQPDEASLSKRYEPTGDRSITIDYRSVN